MPARYKLRSSSEALAEVLARPIDDKHFVQDDELKSKGLADFKYGALGDCPSWYIEGHDADGHTYAKEVYCGREWCPVCGAKWSVSHKRRFARWYDKARQITSMGYFVIEWPIASRHKLKHKAYLTKASTAVKQVFTGEYEIKSRRRAGAMLRRAVVANIRAKWYERGLRRWHYFGDVATELNKTLKGLNWLSDGAITESYGGIRANCHLNVIVDAGYIPKGRLEHIKRCLRSALKEPDLIVHYGYTKEPGRMVHVLKYVTRATFLDYRWDKYLAGQLHKFRNQYSWGSWTEAPTWAEPDLPADVQLELEDTDWYAVSALSRSAAEGGSVSPHSGKPVKWTRICRIGELQSAPFAKQLGAGYWYLGKREHGYITVSDDDVWRQHWQYIAKTSLERQSDSPYQLWWYDLLPLPQSQFSPASYEDVSLEGGGYN